MKIDNEYVLAGFLAILSLIYSSFSFSASNCTPEQISNIKAAPTSSDSEVKINCNLSLSNGDVIRKRLIFEGAAASGVTLNCNRASVDERGTINAGQDMIEVRSRYYVSSGVDYWERPSNVKIQNCDIFGSVRIFGITKSTNDKLKELSKLSDYVQRVRDAAPINISLDNVVITGSTRSPLYVSPGVQNTSLTNSEITGSTSLVGIYLDAETQGNVIKGNNIHPDTTGRELIAIDTSSHNRIINNYFSNVDTGGIFLYRNCGEAGVIRHTSPHDNEIINNVFYYNVYQGPKPAVYIGSRNGTSSYCDLDSYGGAYPYGSSLSDLDYATDNAVMQNRIYQRSVSEMIVVGSPPIGFNVNLHNRISGNETVTSSPTRPAGCYLPTGYKQEFIPHGGTAEGLLNFLGTYCANFSCSDGQLQVSSFCNLNEVSFSCQVSGNNDGCWQSVSCPAGLQPFGAVAACNLENGTVSDNQLASVLPSQVSVTRPSDNIQDGLCWVGLTGVVNERTFVRGPSAGSVLVGCVENDANGGDCHIRGKLFCN